MIQDDSDVGMDQYLLIPCLVRWTSIYQLFWCSPGVQGFDPSPCDDSDVWSLQLCFSTSLITAAVWSWSKLWPKPGFSFGNESNHVKPQLQTICELFWLLGITATGYQNISKHLKTAELKATTLDVCSYWMFYYDWRGLRYTWSFYSDSTCFFRAANAVLGSKKCSQELLKHRADGDLWVALYGQVYDMTELDSQSHPMGKQIIWMSYMISYMISYEFLRKLKWITLSTSSTAQGGGGSFKNRKPIGEVGCCESGMAERSHWWTERCLRSPLFLSLSLFFSLYLCICHLSSCLPVYLSISLSLFHRSICLAV